MKQLYTELQEMGWDFEKPKEKIEEFNKVCGFNPEMETLKEEAERIKRETMTEDEYMEQQEIDEKEEMIRNEPSGEGV